jgi:predicted enzyme related to lactoylglutathione lyase
MHNAASWFDIPVADLDRAARFYGAILGLTLERYSGPGIEGALFPAQGLGGTLLSGEGFVPSHDGSVVYLNGAPDLNAVLERIPPAGGKVLLAKTAIPGNRGFFAYFEDTEGNRVGLHSPG